MSLAQTGFDVLYILSAVDGNIHEKEVQVIKNFLESTYPSLLDCQAEATYLRGLNWTDRFARLKWAADYISKTLSHQDRMKFFNFSVELVCVDGVLTDGERTVLSTLGENWGIDLSKFLYDKFGGFKSSQFESF